MDIEPTYFDIAIQHVIYFNWETASPQIISIQLNDSGISVYLDRFILSDAPKILFIDIVPVLLIRMPHPTNVLDLMLNNLMMRIQ